MRTTTLAALVVLVGGVGVARADEPPAPPPRWHVGLQTGLLLPQLGSELGSALDLELEGGYRLWRGLSVVAGLGFAQPVVSHAADDPRVTAGDYATETRQEELALTAGAMWHLRRPGSPWNVYGAAGLRTYLLRTVTNGMAGGEPFLENTETSLRVGVMAAAGGELGFGWGAGVAELQLGGSDLPHLVTGEVSTTALSLSVGLRVFF